MSPEEVELVRRDYTANAGWETFLSYEDPRQDILIGLLRLRRLPGRRSIVRELHVYGSAVAVHARDTSKHQHQARAHDSKQLHHFTFGRPVGSHVRLIGVMCSLSLSIFVLQNLSCVCTLMNLACTGSKLSHLLKCSEQTFLIVQTVDWLQQCWGNIPPAPEHC